MSASPAGDDQPDWTVHTRRRGLVRLANATRFSLSGIANCWRTEEAFRTEMILTVIGVPLAFWLGRSAVEYGLLIGSLLILLMTELLNSAIETVTDRISTEQHELSRIAKDIASAAVFFGLILVGLVWGLLLWERFW
ncbi:MAG: diacylglycerol kinase [Gammaproteobacteria bacterium]|nr:diacylglycerol kinase [Gammaproteobacteria bacterium]